MGEGERWEKERMGVSVGEEEGGVGEGVGVSCSLMTILSYHALIRHRACLGLFAGDKRRRRRRDEAFD